MSCVKAESCSFGGFAPANMHRWPKLYAPARISISAVRNMTMTFREMDKGGQQSTVSSQREEKALLLTTYVLKAQAHNSLLRC